MGLDDLVNSGKDLFEQNKDKIDGLLHSEQAEQVSDSLLEKGADVAKKIAPDQFDGAIDGVRGTIDGAVGNE